MYFHKYFNDFKLANLFSPNMKNIGLLCLTSFPHDVVYVQYNDVDKSL